MKPKLLKEMDVTFLNNEYDKQSMKNLRVSRNRAIKFR